MTSIKILISSNTKWSGYLTQISGALTIVGDDDQSIYAWRGARPENLNKLSADFPTLKVIKLEQNYRSTRIILEAANTLIARNSHIFEKTLWSDKGFGDRIEILPAKTDEDEAERIASMILERRLNLRQQFSDFAVLYRSNHQARILEFKLQHFKIPYKLSGGTSFFARSEIRDLMSYLRLLINPDDDNALLRIINVPRRRIGPTTLEVLGKYAHERYQPLYACIPEMGLINRLEPEAARRLAQFHQLIERAQRDLLVGQGMHAIDELLEEINYRGWLSDQSSSEPMAENRWGNVMQLLEALRKDLKHDPEEDESMKMIQMTQPSKPRFGNSFSVTFWNAKRKRMTVIESNSLHCMRRKAWNFQTFFSWAWKRICFHIETL